MKERIKKLRSMMKEENLDCVIITSRPNTFYFTGFAGSTSVAVVTERKAFFATDFRYIENAREVCGRSYTVEMCERSPEVYLLEKLRELKIELAGFEEQDVSQGRYSGWVEKTSCSYKGVQAKLGKIREIKDVAEASKIQVAVDLAEKAFEYIIGLIRPGMTENQVAAEIEYYMRKNGASAPAFETIVASGKRSSMPHGHASNKVIEKGDPVTMDFGALVDGYNSDMTRTVFAGEPAGKMKDIYKIVLEAQCASEEMVHAGLTGLEIDRIARDIIYDAGYEGCFGHGLGHGLGIEVHEMPRLSATYPYPIENGNVLSVEPGIYVEGLGGVRIENLVMVRDKNPLVFNKSSKEMIIL